MKEIIVIKKHELYTLLDCLPMPMITDEDLEKEIKEGRKIVLFGKERKAEQVPENFADLLTLCKDTKGCFVLRASDREYIEVPTDLIGYSFTFYQDGQIFADEDVCVKEKATPQQMWQIIKNLIGE